jgi:hypothetical protein
MRQRGKTSSLVWVLPGLEMGIGSMVGRHDCLVRVTSRRATFVLSSRLYLLINLDEKWTAEHYCERVVLEKDPSKQDILTDWR